MRLSFKLSLVALLVVSGLAVSSYLVGAQVLGDVAKQEESRRKDIKKPAKVYTNKDLGPVPESSPGTLSAPGTASEPPKDTVKADTGGTTEKDPKKEQAYWSGRRKDLQSKLDTDQTLADALQSRINALNTDFVNRDDPVQRAGIDKERQKATAELERLKVSVAAGKKALTDLEEEGRKAGVPAGWLR